MLRRSISWVASAAILISSSPAPLYAQPVLPPQEAPPPAPGQGYSTEQMESILAPVALYPDALLTQILMASAFPLQIVEAYRWVQQGNNRNIKGDQLVQTLAGRNWDPSVKSLVPFPGVLAQMNGNLDWLQQLGYAVANQQEDVLDGIQRLRQKAYAAGNLRSNEQCVVRQEENYIYIDPPPSGVVYVPYYNPTVVYGSWSYVSYPPVYFQPEPYWGISPVVGAALVFGTGIAVGAALWGWGRPRWRERNIWVDHNRYNYINVNRPAWRGQDVWRPQHSPSFVHGGGQRYLNTNPPGPLGGPGHGPRWDGNRFEGNRFEGNRGGDFRRPDGFRGDGAPGQQFRDRGAPGTAGNSGIVPRGNQGGGIPGGGGGGGGNELRHRDNFERRGGDPSMRAYQGGGGGGGSQFQGGGGGGGGGNELRHRDNMERRGGDPSMRAYQGGGGGGGSQFQGGGGGGGGGGSPPPQFRRHEGGGGGNPQFGGGGGGGGGGGQQFRRVEPQGAGGGGGHNGGGGGGGGGGGRGGDRGERRHNNNN